MKSLHSFTIDYEAAQIIKHIKKGDKSKYVSEAITQVRYLRNANYELKQDLDQLERANRKMQEVILTLQTRLDTYEQLRYMPRSNEPTQKKRKQTISDYLKSIFR